jgi:hypothetical protein
MRSLRLVRAKRGDSLFDYARSRVLLNIGEPPPGAHLTLRLLARIGRQLLVSSYVRSYERNAVRPLDRPAFATGDREPRGETGGRRPR